MEEVTIIGVELAKNVLQVHEAAAKGSVLFRKKFCRLFKTIAINWLRSVIFSSCFWYPSFFRC